MRKYTIFMLLNATRAWLALDRSARGNFSSDVIGGILERYPDVSLRYYDAEAFSGRCSDVAVFETGDLTAYTFVIDALRDTPFFTAPYFEVVDIIPSVEDSFKEYEATL